jgi:hypothetical protein
MKLKAIIFTILTLFISINTYGQEKFNSRILNEIKESEKAKVLLLGVFHFDNPGLDDFKPQHQLDIHSEERQKEIINIVQRLGDFSPTKIGLEFQHGFQSRVDSLYSLYREEKLQLPTNEIYQLGFRIGVHAGLKQVHGIDAPGKYYSFISELSPEEYDKKAAEYIELGFNEKPNTKIWYPHYQKLYSTEDSLKMERSIISYLRYLNSHDRVQISHGQYFVDSFKFGIGNIDDYFGADMKTRWFNRNLRILQNIYRLIDSTEDRVLIIIGSGHLPILQQAIESSPELELVNIMDYL